ncbi:MAG: hypothetical protein DMG88_06780 [Acidobacteria bacterium]|nr:MAG: hypothetical protein DMG88_06780 [Acidobacteriota bacterium]
MQPLCRRRAGDAFISQQVCYSRIRARQVELGGVHNLIPKRISAGYPNRLRAVIRFLATGAPRAACLRAASIFCARKFVAGIVDYVIFWHGRRLIGLHGRELLWQHYRREQHGGFQDPRNQNTSIRK